MTIRRYTAGRLLKATGFRSLDATFSAAGTAFSALARTTMSLLAGQEQFGWVKGVDGYTAKMLDAGPGEIMGLLSLNEIVYACMRERMKVLISPTFLVERRLPDGTFATEPDHPLSGLIRRPAPNLDTASFWRCLEASYAGLGVVYLEPLLGTRSNGLRGLNPLNPAWIHEDVQNGVVVAYDWQPPEGEPVRFLPDQLIVRRSVDWANIPPLITALQAVDADEQASTFVAGFFGGGGVPSGIVKSSMEWTEERADDFRAAWMRRFTAGSRAPAILDSRIDSYTRIGVSLDEIDNQSVRTFIETRICMCFGVPPLIIYSYAGLLRAIESNLQEAWASFWDATALPLLREWADWITFGLLPFYELMDDITAGNVRARFDVSMIGPYQEDITAKVEMYRQGYDLGAVTMNELRGVMGMAAHPAGDVFKAPPAPPIPYQLPPANPRPADDQPDDEEGKALLLFPAPKAEVVQ